MGTDHIIIKGAREHNLKNIDVTIPRNQLVVITGVSGSGKSSLAFDTIYAEGQRRYVESLSAYARQFLELMGKPDVDTIEGLSPAISIEQKTVSKNPRSTVATVTEIYDYLRLLFARVGHPFCYNCGREIASQTVQQMVDQVAALPEGARINLLAPLVRDRKGEYRKEFDRLRRDGFIRVRVDGELKDLSEDIVLDKKKKHTIEVFVDRLVVRPGRIEKRLADSLETALKLAEGIVKVQMADRPEHELIFSERFACPVCGVSYPEISPRMFSFNNPYGACPDCDGLGSRMYFDPDLIIPDPKLSLRQGVIAPWQKRASDYYWQMLEAVARHYGVTVTTPFDKLPKKVQDVLMRGSGDEDIEFKLESDANMSHSFVRPFEGVMPNLDRRFRETTSDVVREELQRFMSQRPCPTCEGKRLRRESLNVRVGGISIAEVAAMSIKETNEWVDGLKLSPRELEIAARILKELRERLGFLVNVGLDYLTLDRSSATLAGGEGQRIRLATQIGASLVGVLYILDEPSIGLHQRDNQRLIKTLTRLRDLGNTVIVVEHDESTILSADHVIDMGPGAGLRGGSIVAQGTPEEIMNDRRSLTGDYLAGRNYIPTPPRKRAGTRWLGIKGARQNNLKDISARFPVGLFTCVTGVSGSGKSTLVIDTLYRALAQRFYRSHEMPGAHQQLTGMQHIDRVIDIDQSPIGRTPRSNPATYTGLFTPIRDLFTKLPESRLRGYQPGRYSFNVKGGRCEACQGDGMIKIEMHFLPDVFVTCDVCAGRRYNRETLEIKYKGKNIADVLDMTVNQAMEFLGAIPAVRSKLQTLAEVGLGYIKLGQSATTLSGGEAQRIKLSRELSKRATGRTLYILDEPTTGLHFDDIKKLLAVLRRLTESGNTVIVIEHNLDVIKTADWIIDLGPEGGDAGGRVLAEGTPEDVAQTPSSYTGQFLRPLLEKHKKLEAAG
ncbi:MAG TPA: excinuclease ABC subunit UvrA [bacterium]|nr:excinuclease ABC subunit UvrA [bacterium]